MPMLGTEVQGRAYDCFMMLALELGITFFSYFIWAIAIMLEFERRSDWYS